MLLHGPHQLQAGPSTTRSATSSTTNLVRHINRIHPNRLQYGYEVLLPAIPTSWPTTRAWFEETKAAAYLNAQGLGRRGPARFFPSDPPLGRIHGTLRCLRPPLGDNAQTMERRQIPIARPCTAFAGNGGH